MKQDLKDALSLYGVGIWVLLSIITCAGAMNYGYGGERFYLVVGAVTLLLNFYAVFRVGRRLYRRWRDR